MKVNRRFLYKVSGFLFCLCLVLSFTAASVLAEQKAVKTVRVGWYEDAYNITGKNGTRSGYGYEYQQSVAAYTGWKYEYVNAGWPNLLVKMKNAEFDLMSGVSYTDERARQMLFSELPMGFEKYYLYANLHNSGISASDLQTLNGRRIGVLRESVQLEQFLEWEEKHNIHVEYIPMTGFEDAKEKVAKHEVDCVISTETPYWVEAGLSAIAMTGGSKIYFAINKNRPDLKAELDNAMRKMEYDKPFYADDLYKRYLMAASAPVLDNEEKAWLKQHGVIRIGWLDNDDGFSDYDEQTGKVAGVINDYIKFAEERLGKGLLHFELVKLPTQERELEALKNGEIDMIFHSSQIPYFAEKNDVILSNTVLSVTVPAVTTKEFFDESAENTVAVAKDNLLMKYYLNYYYPQWKLVEYASFAEAEKAVRIGQADCFVAKYGQIAKYIEDKGLNVVFLTQPGNVAFAVNRGDTMLLSILNKTLKTMPASMLTGALASYDNSLRKATTLDYIKANLVEVTIFFLAVVTVVFLVILNFLLKSKLAETKARQSAAEARLLNEQLKANRDELKKALVQAEHANAAKTNFLFNMSHDIRTPMNAILGYTRLIKDEFKDPKLLCYQGKMERSGQLLLSIINNVLDMARIESGKVEINLVPCRISDVLQEITAVFEGEAEEKQLSFVREKKLQHEHIMCDVTKIKEIFTNLLSNAIKYTPAGGTIILRSEELPCTKEGYVRVKTEVIDNGIGMSKEFLPTLFDVFSREHNTTAGKIAGTGLGMAIVKKLVDMLGGTISVESETGKGSKFTVILESKIAEDGTYAACGEKPAAVLAEDVIRGKRVLLAEDNELNAEIAVFLLKQMGLEVEWVTDGLRCVEKIKEKSSGTYDVIIMDIQMPNMNGYEATKAICALRDKEKAAIPIVAMTANAFEEDRQNAFKAGMDGHIAKPVDVAKLQEVLAAVLQARK